MGIPVGRVLDKLDAYFERKDFDAAERHLQYWLAEAEAVGDRQGMLTVLNEQIGFYRKMQNESETMKACDCALQTAEDLDLAGTVSMATTLINAATAYKAFGRAAEALPLYEEAKKIYEARLEPSDGRRGGLYNNMALALADLGRYREAEASYEKALAVMVQVPGGELEMAVSRCNMADLAAMELGTDRGREKILHCLEQAWELLNSEKISRDGYYAFVCEKCAPVFGWCDQHHREEELMRRADAIYRNL